MAPSRPDGGAVGQPQGLGSADRNENRNHKRLTTGTPRIRWAVTRLALSCGHALALGWSARATQARRSARR